jgi:hypothetical protein
MSDGYRLIYFSLNRDFLRSIHIMTNNSQAFPQHSADIDTGSNPTDLEDLRIEWLGLPQRIINLRLAEDRARTWIRANEWKQQRILAEARRAELDQIFNPSISQVCAASSEDLPKHAANTSSGAFNKLQTQSMVHHHLPIREAIRRYGLEQLRGRAVFDGPNPVYISDSSLDDAITLWQDEPQNAYLHRRFYGAETYNANLVRWIYSSAVIQVRVNYLTWLTSLKLGDLVEVPYSEDANQIMPMIIKRIEAGILWLLPVDVTEVSASQLIPCCTATGYIRECVAQIVPVSQTQSTKFPAPSKISNTENLPGA